MGHLPHLNFPNCFLITETNKKKAINIYLKNLRERKKKKGEEKEEEAKSLCMLLHVSLTTVSISQEIEEAFGFII